MSLGRMSWGLRLLIIQTISSTVIGNQNQLESRQNFHDRKDLLLSNNLSRSYDDHRSIHYGTIQHQEHNQNRKSTGNGVWLGHWKLPHLRHQHHHHHHGEHNHQPGYQGPYFEDASGQEIEKSDVVANLGDTALLDCRVVMLSGKTVMWIRQSPDKALLTVGESTHIVDKRYEVRFKYPNNWRLAISSIRKEDRGLYVCQVNTHPPRMLLTNFTILAPDIRIVDEASHELRDRYYKTGSVIELTCTSRASSPTSASAAPSRSSSKVPRPVWKKNGDTLPDHINVHHANGTNSELLTRLRIEHARKTDSGEFACTVGQFSTAVVNIHVLNGEKQAAVHHDQWNAASTVRLPSGRQRLFLLAGLPLLLLLLGIGCAYN